jgi:hypothetical protein
MTGNLHRVKVRVPLPFIDYVRRQGGEAGQQNLLSAVEDHVESVGFDDTLLVMEDPTDATSFSLLTRRTNEPITPDPLLSFRSVEPVEEPPASPNQSTIDHPEALDSGLSLDEILMVRQVLLEDMNPRHLNGVAHCFEPFFPIAASLLRTKADLLDVRKTPESKTHKPLDQHVRGRMRALWDRSRSLHKTNISPSEMRSLQASRQAIETLATQTRIPLKVMRDEVRRAVCLMVEEDPDEMPKLARMPKPVVEAARKTLVTLTDLQTPAWRRQLRIVDPCRLNIIVLPDPSKDGFVSPSAVQLALSTSKPAASGVLRPIKSPILYDQLLKAGGSERGMKARAQMERANRLLERRRWVDWWRRRNALRGTLIM